MYEPRRILLLIVIGILAGYAWWRYDHRGVRAPEKFTLATAPKLSLDDVKVLSAIDAEYTKLVQSVVPGVVSITSSRTFTQLAPLTIEDLFAGRQRTQEAKNTSLGSGVIVSKEGHILTNYHVIEGKMIDGKREIRVQLTDGRNLPAALIGTDPMTDIAVLKIEAPNIEVLPLGDSGALRVGQQVFAVGNPYGLEESVSRGIVSAKGRQIGDSITEHIQHDAAVNQGNSGGPLLNVRGEIVGINSQILGSRTGGWQGISFAIPSNAARRILEGIIKNGRMVRSYLGVEMDNVTAVLAQRFGVRMQDVTVAHAQRFGLPDMEGAVILTVTPGSPAAGCGLQPGDVVRTVNGAHVKSAGQLNQMIISAEIGRELKLGFIRAGKLMTAKAKTAATPAELSSPIPGR